LDEIEPGSIVRFTKNRPRFAAETAMRFVPSLLIVAVVATLDVFAQSAQAPPPAGMVLIPAGEFWMGRTHTASLEQAIILERDRRDDQPAHKIQVDAFYIDAHEVTNSEYQRYADATRGAVKPWHWPGGKVAASDERLPVTNVSWTEADSYCRAAGKRLPTEAEWERAARGGLDRKRYPWGDEGGRGRAHTGSATGPTAVGSFAANAYGLYDVAGNVWEWTNDWYERDYYAVSPAANPRGPAKGQYKVIRGGGWTDGAQLNSFRNYADPEARTLIIGFRCAKNAS
jgi:formylglycine-generating enzyme required for sulfatase activity